MIRAFVFAALPFLALAAQEARACSCAPPKPAKAELARADMVFRAKVVAIDEAAEAAATNPGGKLRVKLEVERVWKGELEASFVLNATSPHIGMCAYPWAVGKTYMVYAHGQGEDASTSLCSRTHQVDPTKPDPDAKALGKGQVPKRTAP